jgi:K(+)-stimulated pyrophosphate-energized sodium pump
MFDVQFKTGGNEYTGKAEAQLKNCAAILKAYPAVKIKLGGYTDNTGTEDVNIRVSQKRADKVKADLVKMGAKADQITEAVGYGPKFPVCEANDTPECKARNRRVACKVAVK